MFQKKKFYRFLVGILFSINLSISQAMENKLPLVIEMYSSSSSESNEEENSDSGSMDSHVRWDRNLYNVIKSQSDSFTSDAAPTVNTSQTTETDDKPGGGPILSNITLNKVVQEQAQKSRWPLTPQQTFGCICTGIAAAPIFLSWGSFGNLSISNFIEGLLPGKVPLVPIYPINSTMPLVPLNDPQQKDLMHEFRTDFVFAAGFLIGSGAVYNAASSAFDQATWNRFISFFLCHKTKLEGSYSSNYQSLIKKHFCEKWGSLRSWIYDSYATRFVNGFFWCSLYFDFIVAMEQSIDPKYLPYGLASATLLFPLTLYLFDYLPRDPNANPFHQLTLEQLEDLEMVSMARDLLQYHGLTNNLKALHNLLEYPPVPSLNSEERREQEEEQQKIWNAVTKEAIETVPYRTKLRQVNTIFSTWTSTIQTTAISIPLKGIISYYLDHKLLTFMGAPSDIAMKAAIGRTIVSAPFLTFGSLREHSIVQQEYYRPLDNFFQPTPFGCCGERLAPVLARGTSLIFYAFPTIIYLTRAPLSENADYMVDNFDFTFTLATLFVAGPVWASVNVLLERHFFTPIFHWVAKKCCISHDQQKDELDLMIRLNNLIKGLDKSNLELKIFGNKRLLIHNKEVTKETSLTEETSLIETILLEANESDDLVTDDRQEHNAPHNNDSFFHNNYCTLI